MQMSVSVGLADIHRDPDPDSERVTQALMNEPLLIKEYQGAWLRIELRDYSGWIRRTELAEEPQASSRQFTELAIPYKRPYVVVDVPFTSVYIDAHSRNTFETLYLSTALPLLNVGPFDRYQVALHGGRSGWLDGREVTLRDGDLRYPHRSLSIVTSTARAFLGVPYLWGGKSWRGIDCSGLVQLCYLMAGHLLPRDADQQSDALGPGEIRIDEMAEGDLIFLGREQITHVALALDARTFIHAEGQRFNRVIIHSLNPADERYDRRLSDLMYCIKRV